MKLTQIQEDLIFGTMLGDGNFQKGKSKDKNKPATWRYRAIHADYHYPYLIHKYEILKEFCDSGPNTCTYHDERTNKIYRRSYFNTLQTPIFRYYATKFYTLQNDSWVKGVPNDIGKFLTPRALAYWYMDDGALKWVNKSNAVRLCTDSFKKHEVELLGEALRKNFGFRVSFQKNKEILRISISESSYPLLRDCILEYLLPCMYYKFPDGNKGVFGVGDISNDIVNTFSARKSMDFNSIIDEQEKKM